jgi:hypothetical protein
MLFASKIFGMVPKTKHLNDGVIEDCTRRATSMWKAPLKSDSLFPTLLNSLAAHSAMLESKLR